MVGKFRRLSLFLAALLVCCVSMGGHAATVDVKGDVTDLTVGKRLAGAPVVLWHLRIGSAGDHGAAKQLGEGTTDATGHFAFPSVNVAAGDLLTVRTNWQGYPYEMPAYDGAGSMNKMFGVKVNPGDVSIEVWDSTPKLDIVERVHHLAIESRPDGMKCTERMVLENPTKHLYLGDGPDQVTYKLALPAGAHDVKLDPKILDAQLVKLNDGYGVSMPIKPSQREDDNALIISYMVDWAGKMPWSHRVDLSRKLIYPVRFFFVNRAEGDRSLVVEAPQLSADTDQGIPVNGQTETRIVNSKGFPMSDEPVFDAGTQVAVSVSRPVNPLFWAFLMFLAALILMVPLALLGKPKATLENNIKIQEPAGVAFVNSKSFTILPVVRPSALACNLIERIAQLDDEWERGAIGAQEYNARRAEWKLSLVQALSADQQGENIAI